MDGYSTLGILVAEPVSVGGAKFCVLCTHIATRSTGNWEQYLCFSPKNLVNRKLNLVTGHEEKEYRFPYCKNAREGKEDACGAVALWYEEKPPESFVRKDNDRAIVRDTKSLASEL